MSKEARWQEDQTLWLRLKQPMQPKAARNMAKPQLINDYLVLPVG